MAAQVRVTAQVEVAAQLGEAEQVGEAAQVREAVQVGVVAQVGVAEQVGVQVSLAGALTGMPSLVRCLFILITTGSSGPGVLSSGVATGDASASMD